ncbi:MAG: T9SS type A sorting domain-containing protein [Bacteroidales bacterium]|nr:T9SS type A sorting domain-containing protein [Bacteroidales bacterium]
MRKILQILSLTALLAVPWATQAQTYEPLPYSTGFEGLSTGQQPAGWTAIQTGVNGSTTFPCAYSYAANTHSGSVYYEFEASYSSSDTEIVALPYMQNISSLMLTMWVSTSSSYPCSLEVGVLESDNSFTSVETLNLTTFSGGSAWASNYHEYTVFTASYTGSGERLALRAIRTGSGQYTMFIDDLSVSEFTGCYPINNLHSTASDGESITIAWSDVMNTSASYTVRYWKDGSTDTTTVSGINDTNYTATNLDAISEYHFIVTPNCGSGDGNPVSGSFSTDCASGGCDITVDMVDSYGDGWNGARLNVYQGGSLSGYAQLTSGNNNTATIHVCAGAPVSFSWQTGSYDSECSYIIYDGGMSVIYNSANGGLNYSGSIANACPSCLSPTGLTASNATETSITLSWNPASSNDYAVYIDGQFEASLTDTTYTFTGLNASTAYTLGVQIICTGADSSNIMTVVARTSCGAISLPFTDNFDSYENGAWPPCWNRLRAHGTDPSVNAQFHSSGTQSMFQLASNDTTLFCTPSAIPTSGDNIFVRYKAFLNWASYYSGTKWIKAGVMTDTSDMSTFIALDSVGYHNFNNEFEEREFNTISLDPTATYWVAWMYYSDNIGYGSYNRGAIDDVYISELPSCLRVTDVVLDSAMSDGLTISWAYNGSTGYTVYYWADGDTDTLTATASDTTITLTGLDELTMYHLYVVSNCSGDDAEPSPEYSFATTCASSVCNLTAYVTDSYNDSWNGCGINIVQGGVTVATIECPSSQSGSTFSYEVCSSAPVRLTFTRGSYPNELGGYIMDGGGNTVFTISNMGNYYTDDSLAYIANPCPNCISPIGLSVSNITANGATLSWTAQDGQSNWIVRIDSNYYNVTDTFYTFTGLDARTSYTVYVATDCGAGDTSSFVSYTFTTDCATGSCDMTITSTAAYVYSSYCPTIHVWQNGEETASVNAETAHVNVCSGLPVTLIYEEPYYDFGDNPSVVVLDGGESELFNGPTGSYSTGDTLVVTPNACPSCLTPTGLRVTYIDSNELAFQWDYVDSVDAYVVSFNGDSVWGIADSVYNAFGLDANTAYSFSVRAICETGIDTSNARTITVKTSCGQMAIPYMESFEYDPQGNVPSCWTVITPGYNGNPMIDGNGHTGSNSLGMHSDGYTPCMIATSAIPLYGDSVYVSFWAKNDDYYGGSFIEAGVMTNLASDTTFISMVTVPISSDYARYEFNTSSLTTFHDSTFYLAFRYTNSGTYYGANIDDINITLFEGCMYPANIVSTPTAHSMALAWHNNGTTGDFAVQYRVYGTTDWDTNDFGTIDTVFNLTNLDAATTYEIRIGTICGLDTLWTVVTAQTTCDIISLPYYEAFVSADGTLPPCWDYTNPVYFHWNRYTDHSETSGDGELMAGANSAGEYAILPQFNSSIIKIQISFKAKLGNVSEGDSMLFGVYDSYSNTVYRAGAMAINGQSRENFVVFTYAYTDYAGIGDRIAIGHSHNNSNGDWGFAVDSIVVIQLPDCLPPANVEAHNTMYPNTADDIYFTWTANDMALGYQVYIDTITSTVAIDSVPDSLLINVDTNYYHVPFNSLAYGAHYRFFVRSDCGYESGNWVELQNGFTTDEVWMNQTPNGPITFDTVIGCDFVVYDNGGPVAGYLHDSYSGLVLISGDDGRELQIQGGTFSYGQSNSTFTVYDGIGTNGDVLFSRNYNELVDESFDSVLATSTTGALTITFTSGYLANNGYELYVHCVGTALCERPTRVHAEMTEVGEATVTWQGSANSYDVYYKISSDSIWNVNTVTTNSLVLTGLVPDTNYDLYVVGDCDSNGTSTPSATTHFVSHFTVVIAPCEGVSDITVTDITTNSALVQWVSDATDWEMEISRIGAAPDTVNVTTNPYTLTGLLPSMQYSVRMRSLCDGPRVEPYSEWSPSVSFTTENPGPGPQGIDGVDGNCELHLFPNPANTTVTVSFVGINGWATIEIVDISGRTISEFRTSNSELTVNISDLSQGAYFVRVTGEQATAVRRLIVK